jgi:hypothetical protein
MNLAMLIGLQVLLQILGYTIMGIGLRLGWLAADKILKFLCWANRKLK